MILMSKQVKKNRKKERIKNSLRRRSRRRRRRREIKFNYKIKLWCCKYLIKNVHQWTIKLQLNVFFPLSLHASLFPPDIFNNLFQHISSDNTRNKTIFCHTVSINSQTLDRNLNCRTHFQTKGVNAIIYQKFRNT